MASDSRVQVAIAANTAEFKAGVQDVISSVRQLTSVLATGMGTTVPQAIKPANEAMGGMMDKLRQFRTEQVQQGRMARFYAGELMAIVPAADAVGTTLKGLAGIGIEGLMGGVGIGLALESLKLVVSLFTEAGRKADEFNQKKLDLIKNELKGVEGAALEASDAVLKALGGNVDNAKAERQIQAAKAALDELQRKVAVYQESVREEDRKAYKEALENYRRLIALSDQAAADRKKAAGLEADDKSRKDALKAIEDERKAWEDLASKMRDAMIAAQDKLVPGFNNQMGPRTPIGFAGDDILSGAEANQKALLMEAQAGERSRKMREEMAKGWMGVGATIGESVGVAFASIVTGSASAAKAMAGLAKSILNTIIEMVKKIIMANAAAAAAEAATSKAGIPIVGPVLAASAMVAMLSMVQGLVGSVPSAAGGWDRVPYDTMAMIHKDEKILPADKARGLDDLISRGGAGNTYNVELTTLDPVSLEQYLKRNPGVLVRALSYAAKNRST